MFVCCVLLFCRMCWAQRDELRQMRLRPPALLHHHAMRPMACAVARCCMQPLPCNSAGVHPLHPFLPAAFPATHTHTHPPPSPPFPLPRAYVRAATAGQADGSRLCGAAHPRRPGRGRSSQGRGGRRRAPSLVVRCPVQAGHGQEGRQGRSQQGAAAAAVIVRSCRGRRRRGRGPRVAAARAAAGGHCGLRL